MRGITFITDETNNKRFVQIDLETISKGEEQIEEIIDIIIAESRKNEKEFSWDEVKKMIRKKKKG